MVHSVEDRRVTIGIEITGKAGIQQGGCAELEEKEASGSRTLKRSCRAFKLEHFFSLEVLWKFSLFFSLEALCLFCAVTFQVE